jgi:hypothetical protein
MTSCGYVTSEAVILEIEEQMNIAMEERSVT